MFIALAQSAGGRLTARHRPPGQAATTHAGPATPPVVDVPLAWVEAFEEGMARYGWTRSTTGRPGGGREYHDPDHVLAATALVVLADMVHTGRVTADQLTALTPPLPTTQLPAPTRPALEAPRDPA